MAKENRRETELQSDEEEIEERAEGVEQAEEVTAGEEEPVEALVELDQMHEDLDKAKTQAAEYLDGWQRTQAEFSNYKKRQEADRAQMIALANANLLRKLLPVLDDFERAVASLPSSLSQLTWCEGVFLIKHKLDAVLKSEGV